MPTQGRNAGYDPLFDPLPPGDGASQRGARPEENPYAGEAPSSLVRPYAVTGGRTRPTSELALETLVSSLDAPPVTGPAQTPEWRAISELCREWRSVAEVSALLRIPLGVARVLIGDMADRRLVQVRQPALDQGRPDLNLLERVLSGLRKL
ncbi:DUF742 domain-containing protein [Allonocardiopsis opalescens]|nr:DUF742 domain-containing protein [Allonocardiopsis opalescens]